MKLRQSKRRQLRMSIDEEKKTITMEEKGICEIVSNLLAKYDNITKQFYEIALTKDFLNEEYIEYIFFYTTAFIRRCCLFIKVPFYI